MKNSCVKCGGTQFKYNIFTIGKIVSCAKCGHIMKQLPYHDKSKDTTTEDSSPTELTEQVHNYNDKHLITEKYYYNKSEAQQEVPSNQQNNSNIQDITSISKERAYALHNQYTNTYKTVKQSQKKIHENILQRPDYIPPSAQSNAEDAVKQRMQQVSERSNRDHHAQHTNQEERLQSRKADLPKRQAPEVSKLKSANIIESYNKAQENNNNTNNKHTKTVENVATQAPNTHPTKQQNNQAQSLAQKESEQTDSKAQAVAQKESAQTDNKAQAVAPKESEQTDNKAQAVAQKDSAQTDNKAQAVAKKDSAQTDSKSKVVVQKVITKNPNNTKKVDQKDFNIINNPKLIAGKRNDSKAQKTKIKSTKYNIQSIYKGSISILDILLQYIQKSPLKFSLNITLILFSIYIFNSLFHSSLIQANSIFTKHLKSQPDISRSNNTNSSNGHKFTAKLHNGPKELVLSNVDNEKYIESVQEYVVDNPDQTGVTAERSGTSSPNTTQHKISKYTANPYNVNDISTIIQNNRMSAVSSFMHTIDIVKHNIFNNIKLYNLDSSWKILKLGNSFINNTIIVNNSKHIYLVKKININFLNIKGKVIKTEKIYLNYVLKPQSQHQVILNLSNAPVNTYRSYATIDEVEKIKI